MLSETPEQAPTTDNTSDTDAAFTAMPSLFRHSKRNEWGLGVILEHRPDRVTMQFQDGRARAMHLDYWDLLQPADRTFDTAHALVTALHAMAPDELRPVWKKTARPISLEEQVLYFRTLYSEGFRSEEYIAQHRTDGRKRLLKRHRDAMLTAAQKFLTRDALRLTEETDGPTGIHASLRKVLDASSLVPAKERTRFAAIEGEHHGRIADALRGLLRGKAPIVQRLDSWVRVLEAALGEAPSWELATYFLGAFHPNTMPVIRPRMFERQARFMAPGLRVGDRPMGILYQRLVAMLTDIRTQLSERGLEARDFVDVFDFVWVTLKPAGRERILELRAERRDDDAVETSAAERAAA